MSNRLSNDRREDLTKLPVWTTEADRRRALSYVDRQLEGAHIDTALEAVRTGNQAPDDLGLLVAIARYEAGGWQPDGCYDRWARWDSHGSISARRHIRDRLTIPELVQWMDGVEKNMQSGLHELEMRLISQCKRADENLYLARDTASRARKSLDAHYRALTLAKLASDPTVGE